MPKLRTNTDKLLLVAAVAGFAASRIIPIPKPVLMVAGILFSAVILWLCGRVFFRKRQENRKIERTHGLPLFATGMSCNGRKVI